MIHFHFHCFPQTNTFVAHLHKKTVSNNKSKVKRNWKMWMEMRFLAKNFTATKNKLSKQKRKTFKCETIFFSIVNRQTAPMSRINKSTFLSWMAFFVMFAQSLEIEFWLRWKVTCFCDWKGGLRNILIFLWSKFLKFLDQLMLFLINWIKKNFISQKTPKSLKSWEFC